MKYGKFIALIGLAFALLIGCVSTSTSNPSRGPLYTGDGGKGISLAILAPKANGLASDQTYLPALVQGEFVSNFSGYSAMSVMDRENLDKVYAELLSGYYDDDDDAGLDLGHLRATDYLMEGNIIRTATGYSLQMQIVKTDDKITVASYSGTCTFAELDNLTGVRRASLDLLQKMGVTLTEKARTELARAAASDHINGQTALAQGITAQRGGTVVEAMSYYYEAAQFDPSLGEAVNRLSTVSASVRTGSIGVDVRQRIAERESWLSVLRQCGEYYANHLPVEISYSSRLTEKNLNYENGTVDLQFVLSTRQSGNIKIMQDVLSGLSKTKKAEEWGFADWPLQYRDGTYLYSDESYGNSFDYRRDGVNYFATYHFQGPSYVDNIGKYGSYRVSYARYRSDANGNNRSLVYNTRPTTYDDRESLSNGLIMGAGRQDGVLQTLMRFNLYNEKGNKISESTFIWVCLISSSGNKINISSENRNVLFRGVNANDITDKLTIRLVSVDGIPANEATQSGYVRVTVRN
jgi:hypothetical protein